MKESYFIESPKKQKCEDESSPTGDNDEKVKVVEEVKEVENKKSKKNNNEIDEDSSRHFNNDFDNHSIPSIPDSPPSDDPNNMNDTFHLERRYFINPFTLRFTDSVRETLYTESSLLSMVQHDQMTHVIGMFPGPMFLILYGYKMPYWLIMLWVYFSCIMAVKFYYLSNYCPRTYHKYRDAIAIWIRTMVNFGYIGLGMIDTLPEATVIAVIGKILIKSPIINMIVSAMNLRLSFRQHCFWHVICYVLGLYWIPVFCNKCAEAPELNAVFTKIGSSIDGSISNTILRGVEMSLPDEYPCWMISAFFMTTFGLIFPTVVIFCTEMSSRTEFAKNRLSDEGIQLLLKDGFSLSLWSSAFGVAGTWALLSWMNSQNTYKL